MGDHRHFQTLSEKVFLGYTGYGDGGKQGFTFGVPLKRMFLPRKLQKKPEKKIKLKMFA